jgi:ABC-type transport system involved in cytochrome bd biosynthesis fused ATPase/permease subunit
LSSTCVLCTLCCQFLRIVHFWLVVRYSLMFVVLDLCLVYPMLPVSRDCPFQGQQTIENTERAIRNGQSWETGNIGYTGHKSRTTNIREYRTSNQKWTIQRNWQHRVHRTRSVFSNVCCSWLVSCVLYVASFSGLSISDCSFGIL